MKLCKDCEHFAPATGKCMVAPKPDPVYGRAMFFSADMERRSLVPGDCGPEGRKWEAWKAPRTISERV